MQANLLNKEWRNHNFCKKNSATTHIYRRHTLPKWYQHHIIMNCLARLIDPQYVFPAFCFLCHYEVVTSWLRHQISNYIKLINHNRYIPNFSMTPIWLNENKVTIVTSYHFQKYDCDVINNNLIEPEVLKNTVCLSHLSSSFFLYLTDGCSGQTREYTQG